LYRTMAGPSTGAVHVITKSITSSGNSHRVLTNHTIDGNSRLNDTTTATLNFPAA
jgi:hypothetical protein